MKVFSHDAESAFAMDTYWGRLQHFQQLINPLNLFTSDQTLLKYKQMLIDHKASSFSEKLSNQELWRMKYLIMSNLHPDTQECLPKVCRLAAFVPVNIPIMIMISLMPQTRLVVISSQSLNQTYNFVFNYANRNASNSFSNLQIAMAYSGAVGTAVVVSLNLPTVAQKLPVPAKAKALLITAAPFFGIVSANVFNLFFSRFKDFSNGINVSGVLKNGTKEELKEKSLIAAKKAFILTGIIRAAVPVPIFFLPKIAQYAIEKRGLYPKNSVGTLLINTAISGVCLYMGLSACISFFPQNIEVTPLEMEPVFQTLKDSNNLPYHGFSFNKGL